MQILGTTTTFSAKIKITKITTIVDRPNYNMSLSTTNHSKLQQTKNNLAFLFQQIKKLITNQTKMICSIKL